MAANAQNLSPNDLPWFLHPTAEGKEWQKQLNSAIQAQDEQKLISISTNLRHYWAEAKTTGEKLTGTLWDSKDEHGLTAKNWLQRAKVTYDMIESINTITSKIRDKAKFTVAR